jgi:uncharacterized protein YciI
VATWQEHLRQHLERGTVVDQKNQEAARALAKDDPHVRHLIFAEPAKPGQT